MVWESIYIGCHVVFASLVGLRPPVPRKKSRGNPRSGVAEYVRNIRGNRQKKVGLSKKKHPPSPATGMTGVEKATGLEMLLALEPRIMFDGAALLTGAEVTQDQVTQDLSTQDQDLPGNDIEAETSLNPLTDSIDLFSALSTVPAPFDRQEIVFIDTGVEDYQTLLLGIDPSAEVVLLDSTRDGIEQIAEMLGDRSDIDAIHIISHGNQGELYLGTGVLNLASMQGAYADELATINRVLTDEADWLIYGCNFGEGELGKDAATLLADLTGADIAASTDDTGSAAFGGDWELEYTTGEIESAVAVSAEAQGAWKGLLATETLLDNFATNSYSNNDGTQLWSTDWVEVDSGGGGGAGIGDIQINSGDLRVQATTLNDNIYREANLTGASTTTFSFSYTNGLTQASESIVVQVSGNGGGLYTTLDTFDISTNTGSGLKVYDISASIASNTRIRILVEGASGGTDNVRFDDVQIQYATTVNTVPINTVPGAQAVAEDTSLAIGGISVNDVDGNLSTVQLSVTNGTLNVMLSGAATINAGADGTNTLTLSGTQTDINATLASLTYLGTLNYFGADTLTVLSTDSDAAIDSDIVNITVNPALVVTTIADNNDSGIVDGNLSHDNNWLIANMGLDSAISLREAIIAAQNTTGIDTIDFDITGSHVISVLSALPDITDAVIIDGTTEPHLGSTPIIELDGISAGAVDGLRLIAGSDGSTIRGLVINRFGGHGIEINNSDGNTIVGNYIGTDVTGTVDLGNSSAGIYLFSAQNNMIGGTTAADRNLISGNQGSGILRQGSNGGNVIQGNYIGTDVTGTLDLGNTQNGIAFDGSGADTIGGAVAGAGNLISGNNMDGISIGAGANSVTIQGNYIGTNAAGTGTIANAGDGISVNADSTQIGGTIALARNVISGNTGNGIYSTGASNTVEGNYIGLDVTGAVDLGNANDGIEINGGAGSNTIGGTAAGAGNVISGNDQHGLSVFNSDSNTVLGNYLGTNAAGTAAMMNSIHGIQVSGGSSNNFIGGSAAGSRNVVSGNNNFGIYILDAATANNVVRGNYIGLNANGDAAVSNGALGIAVDFNAPGTIIGGTGANEGNVISGNTGTVGSASRGGIYLSAQNTTIQGNLIGLDAAESTIIANGMVSATSAGIVVTNTSSGNVIGGAASTAGNTIAGNVGAGILVNSGATQNTILGNQIYSNTELGIDLDNDGVTANDVVDGDPDPGGNNLQNFPVLTTAITDGTGVVSIDGTLNSLAGQTFRIEFFSNTAGDGSGYGEGENYLGFVDVTADGSGNASFRRTLEVTVPVGSAISATATLMIGPSTYSDTSEFASNVAATSGSLTVTTSNDLLNGDTASVIALLAADGGDGISLREAITAANNTTGRDTIVFNIAGAGPHTIQVNNPGDGSLGALPGITEAVIIDGYTETGASVNTLSVGTDAVIQIELDGQFTSSSEDGLTFFTGTDTSIIRGLAIHSFDGDGIELLDADGMTIEGNYIGTDVAGLIVKANTLKGIRLNSGASNNLIGGTTLAARNVIAGNTQDGIYIAGIGSTGNTIAGNYIGVDATGAAPLGNGNDGIEIRSANNTIGGITGSARNIISGNNEFGIRVTGAGTTGNTIAGNYIGLDAGGTLDRGNAGHGIGVGTGAATTTIGGTAAGAGNVISGNNDRGIRFLAAGAAGNTVQGNLIGTDYTGLIDLGNLQDGIEVSNSDNVAIGGTVANARNVIAGNASHGIEILGSDNAIIQGNYIGLGSDGSTVLAGQLDGIHITNSSTNITIGGATAAHRNVFSGNTQDGIKVSSASNTTIEGNYIGTDVTGTVDLGNGDEGIEVLSATNTTIGGSVVGARNVIAGNTSAGIRDENSSGTTIKGNYIGVDATGTGIMGNAFGIQTWTGSTNGVLGGSGANEGNVIGGNTNQGILLYSASGYTVQGNYIGTDSTGTLDLGNLGNGISISTLSTNHFIGGTVAGEGNVIAFNDLDGISVSGSTSTGNSIIGNQIYSNSELGIDLSGGTENGFGVTANDAGDADTGANLLQNYPVLSLVTTTGIQVTITGSLNSTANTTVRIEFFASPTADGSGSGEAERYLGFTTVTTDLSGNAMISETQSWAVASGENVTGTATVIDDVGQVGIDVALAYGDTSEFSQNTIALTVPVNTVPATAMVAEDAALAMAGANLISVSDVDGNLASTQLTVGNGSLTVSLSGAAIISAGANGTGTLTISGSQADINATLASLNYQGNLNYFGADTLTVLSTDGDGLTDSDSVAITVGSANDAPVITSHGGGGSANLSLAENLTGVTTMTATDVDVPADILTYSILGGADAARFAIDATTGALQFVAPPDFETPTDVGGDNVYDVQVQVSDGQGGTDTQSLAITVIDVFEGAPPPLPSPPPPDPTPDPPPESSPEPESDPGTLVTSPGGTGSARVGSGFLDDGGLLGLGLVEEEQLAVSHEAVDVLDLPPFLRPGSWATTADQLRSYYPDPSNMTKTELSSEFFQQLNAFSDKLGKTMEDQVEKRSLIADMLKGAGLTLSAGLLAWLIRGGTLLAWLLASLPAWRHFDPVPILNMDKKDKEAWTRRVQEAANMEAREHQGLEQILHSKMDEAPPVPIQAPQNSSFIELSPRKFS